MNVLLKKANMGLELVIVGGATFILKNLVPRATSDFINQTNQKAVLTLNQKGFDVNGRVDTFIYQFGTWWHMDLELPIKTNNLTVKTISTKRLMVSRLLLIKDMKILRPQLLAEKFHNINSKKYSRMFIPLLMRWVKETLLKIHTWLKNYMIRKGETMRVQTLNTYVIAKLKEYYKKPLRFKSLLKDS